MEGNWTRFEHANVILLDRSVSGVESLVAWELAQEGDVCETCGKPAHMIARDLSIFGTHGDVGLCVRHWNQDTNNEDITVFERRGVKRWKLL